MWLKDLKLLASNLASLRNDPQNEFIVNVLNEYEHDLKKLRAEVKREFKPPLERESRAGGRARKSGWHL